MSSELIWELTKNWNAFQVKNLNRSVWSKEAGNLAGKSSYKYSGIANLGKTVDVSEVDGAIAISVSSKKNKTKLATTLAKKNTRRTIHAAGAVAASKRADLKTAAKARAAALSKAISKRKATAAAN